MRLEDAKECGKLFCFSVQPVLPAASSSGVATDDEEEEHDENAMGKKYFLVANSQQDANVRQ